MWFRPRRVAHRRLKNPFDIDIDANEVLNASAQDKSIEDCNQITITNEEGRL